MGKVVKAEAPDVDSQKWLAILQKTEMRALASVSKDITQLIGSTNTSASALATMILKDAALTSQVLKIANSVAYKANQVTAVSKHQESTLKKAIIRIGFNGIRCICISIALVDSIVKNPAKQQRLLKCMAQSFHTAAHARNAAQLIKGCRSEDVFIAGLLQNLGELVFWTSPIAETAEFKQHLDAANDNPEAAALGLTGMNFVDMSKQLAELWSLSETLSDSFNPAKQGAEVKAVNLGNMMSRGVEAGWESKELKSALSKITKDFSLDLSKGMALIRKGADEAIVMANEFAPGLGRALQPVTEMPCIKTMEPVDDIVGTEKSSAHKSSATTKTNNQADASTAKVQTSKSIQKQVEKTKVKPARPPSSDKFIEIIEQLWDLAETEKPIAGVCKLMADGIFDAIGFERVAVFIKVNKKEEIKLAYLAGKNIEHWTKDLVLAIDDKHESIFRYGSRSNGPVWASPDKTSGLEKLISKPVAELIGNEKRFVLSPIKSGLKVVALVYADMAGEQLNISDEHFAAFSRFTKQASRALSSS